jgi:hypothetical protein
MPVNQKSNTMYDFACEIHAFFFILSFFVSTIISDNSSATRLSSLSISPVRRAVLPRASDQ